MVNDFVSIEKLKGEHGLSFFIKTPLKKILFDTGQGDLFLQNAKLLDIDIEEIDMLVLSHNHYDHTGGVPVFLRNNYKAKIFAHPDAIRQSYSSSRRGIPDSIYYKTEKSGKALRKIGFDTQIFTKTSDTNNMNKQNSFSKERFVLNKNNIRVADGIWLTGEIPRETGFEKQEGSIFRDENLTKPDTIPDDQALIITGKKEMAIILGCCHAGIVNTVEYARKLFPELKLKYIIGGMHLITTSSARINLIIEYLEQFSSLHIFHGHCTGFKAGCAMNSAFKKRAEFFYVGKHYELEIN